MKAKKFEIPINEEPREEGSPQVVETQIQKILHGLLKHNPSIGQARELERLRI